MLAPTKFRAKLQEPVLSVDPTSNQTAEQLPTYNAYSADGDVTAPLVYVNYGNREDYEELDRLGISVKGAIVIARYGGGWRGIKPKVAAEHGAIGCIIYSDPRGDGYFHGDDYPAGGWRPRDGVQRGSVMDTDYPGDPLTPGVGATPDAKRLAIKDAKTITRKFRSCRSPTPMPCRCSRRSRVRSRPKAGAAPAHHLSRRPRSGAGASESRIQLGHQTDLRRDRHPARLRRRPVGDPRQPPRRLGQRRRRSHLRPGRHARRSAHARRTAQAGLDARSAPSSIAPGTAKSPACWVPWNGWKPIWTNCRSTPSPTSTPTATSAASSSPAERRTCRASSAASPATSRIRKPTCPSSSARIWWRIARAKNAEERGDLRKRDDLVLAALGDGSDYHRLSGFRRHLHPDVGFGGEDDGDQYHSIYDDFYWYTHFVDTDFVYGRALAQTAGTAMMRLADADLIPYDYAPAGRSHCEVRSRARKAAERQAGRIHRAQSANSRKASSPRPRIRTKPRFHRLPKRSRPT